MMDDREARTRASLARIYAANYEKIIARVNAVETAIRTLLTADLPAEQRRAAESEAHKLAGVLGTFGIGEGTSLAREIEQSLKGEDAIAPQAAAHLATLAEQLRQLIKEPTI